MKDKFKEAMYLTFKGKRIKENPIIEIKDIETLFEYLEDFFCDWVNLETFTSRLIDIGWIKKSGEENKMTEDKVLTEKEVKLLYEDANQSTYTDFKKHLIDSGYMEKPKPLDVLAVEAYSAYCIDFGYDKDVDRVIKAFREAIKELNKEIEELKIGRK